jgi:Antitoxin-like ribbon-helix-helix
MTTRPSSLQAVLARQAVSPPQAPIPAQPTAPPLAAEQPLAPQATIAKSERFYRPSRDGRRFLGGHFDPKVVRQMKMLAAEEDTTTQALLEEAIDLLFLKKGRGKIIGT